MRRTRPALSAGAGVGAPLRTWRRQLILVTGDNPSFPYFVDRTDSPMFKGTDYEIGGDRRHVSAVNVGAVEALALNEMIANGT
jgi:hypothetical protein